MMQFASPTKNFVEVPAMLGLLALRSNGATMVYRPPARSAISEKKSSNSGSGVVKKVDEASVPSPVRILRSMFPEEHRRNPYVAHQQQRGGRGADCAAGDEYSADAARAIRSDDVAALEKLLEREGADVFNACNRNGESLLHLACRRGSVETIRFLVERTSIPIDVRDSLGRTVLHDACWRPRPDFEVLDVLIRAAPPKLLLAEDSRGHTPFDYVRRGDWKVWIDFVRSRRDVVGRRIAVSCV